MGAVTELASWAAALRLEDAPSTVAERARMQRLSTIAAAHAGAGSAGVRRLRAAVREWAAGGPAEVVGEDWLLEPSAAAYANAAASIAHDWDDYLYMGHTCHSSVWVTEALGGTAEERLVAQIAANEISGRLGAALVIGPHNGQFWASIHAAGAAVAAGRLLGLDTERLGHALAIALYQPPYGLYPGFMGPDTKLITAAEPAAAGMRAATLAAHGFSGALDVIESPRGLLAHFAFIGQPRRLEGLGEVWLTDTLAFKEYPGCAYLQAPVDALLALGPPRAQDVESIIVRCGYLTIAMEALSAGAQLTPVTVNFSVALSFAAILLAGRLTPAELSEDWLAANAAEMRRLASRVRLEHDWALTMRTLRGASGPETAALLRTTPLRRWLGVRRRMHELGMDELDIGARELIALLREPALRGLLKGRSDGLRLTFPGHVRIRLRSGEERSAEGRERGACGAPLEEQREVVEGKLRVGAR